MSNVAGHNIISDPAEAARELGKDSLIGFDAETTGFSPWRNSLALLQFYGDQTGTTALIRTPDGIIPPPIKDLLESRDKTFIVHNGVAFDIPFLYTHGVDPFKTTWFDTLVAETAIVPTNRRDISVSLRASVRRRLGVEVNKDIEHSNWGASVLSEKQIEYAAADVISLPALYRAQIERATEAGILKGIELEQKLVPCVASMTITGLPISLGKYAEYVKAQEINRDSALLELQAALPEVKNWRSPKQIGEALYSRGIPLPTTKSGQRSTAKGLLERYARYGGANGVLCRLLMKYKHSDQRLKTYTQEWIDKFVMADGRVHAKFWQCSTDTTRFSSSEPSLQVIPKDMRYVFGWVPGYKMVTPDYNQIEVLITASIAGDRAMLDHLAAGGDIHAQVAEEILGFAPADQTEEVRRFAKALVFTMLFGGGAKRIIEYIDFAGLDVGDDEVYDFMEQFFDHYPGIKAMRDSAQIKSEGYPKIPVTITLPSGLKRRLVGKQVRPPVIINTLVQGSAAVGIKMGMLEAWNRGVFNGYVGAQVHDELPACVSESELDDFLPEIKEAMSVGMTEAIGEPCTVDAKVGDGWPK